MQKRSFHMEVPDDDMVAVLRRKTPAERLAASFEMWRFASERLKHVLRSQNPEWNEVRLRAETRRRLLGTT